jgi:hypothetical protein
MTLRNSFSVFRGRQNSDYSQRFLFIFLVIKLREPIRMPRVRAALILDILYMALSVYTTNTKINILVPGFHIKYSTDVRPYIKKNITE